MASRSKRKLSVSRSPTPHKERRLSSSASTSATIDISELILLKRKLGSMTAEACAEKNIYNLSVLEPSLCQLDLDHDNFCFRYVSDLVKGDPGLSTLLRQKVTHFAELHPLYATTDKRPDVLIARDGFPLVQFEVHSSSFDNTIRKCILGVIDQLRLYRTFSENTAECSGFVFPKLTVLQCVVKVTVTWEKNVFSYSLTCIEEPQEVRKAVVEELQKAKTRAPSPNLPQRTEYLVQLSEEDLHMFGGSTAVQVASKRSILVKCDRHYFKMPAYNSEATTLGRVSTQQIPHSIRIEPSFISESLLWKYEGLPHDPLTPVEALSCLRELVLQLVDAINGIHGAGWAHQDIRLENICFNHESQPIFIDLDRCKYGSLRFDGMGCMFNCNFTSFQQDWLQLGLLICWITNPVGSYHDRNLEEVCKNNADEFLQSLMRKGRHCPLDCPAVYQNTDHSK